MAKTNEQMEELKRKVKEKVRSENSDDGKPMRKSSLSKKDIDQMIKRFDQIKTDNQVWRDTWDELTRHYFPKRKPILTQTATEGQRYGHFIHSSVPPIAVSQAAAVLQSTLMNRETDWLDAEIGQVKGFDKSKMEDLNDNDEVKRWTEHVVDVVSKELANSNFYSQAGKYCLDLLGYGHALFYSEESKKPGKTLHFSAREIAEVQFALDDQDELIFFGRLMKRTAAQLVKRFKGNVPAGVTKEYKEGNPEKKFEVYHFCDLRDVYDDSKYNSQNMRFGSYWIEKETKHVMKESGYNEMPLLSAPWIQATGEKYGRGPSYDALADVKELYAREDSRTMTEELIANPPYQMPSTGFMNEPLLRPGQPFYYQPGTTDMVKGIDIWSGGVPTLNVSNERKEDDIRNAFYLNQLQLIDKKSMTAEEARIRTIENAKIIGPAYGNQIDSFLSPFLERVIGILRRAGKIEDPPEILVDHELTFKYISPLAKAQAAYEINGIMTVVGTAISWSEADPEALDNIDIDFALNKLAELEGTPTGLFKEESAIKDIRDQRKALQERQMEIQEMEATANIGNTEADTENKQANAA